MRLKHYCADAGQYGVNVSPDEYGVEGLRMVRTSDLTDSGLRPAGEGVFIRVPVPAVQMLEPGDILLSRAGTIGRSYLVPDEAAGHTFAGFLVRFRPSSDADPRFVTYAIQSTLVQQQITADAVTSTISNFNADKYANLELPTAPLEEQRRIADFLDDRVARIDQIIAARQQQLGLGATLRWRELEARLASRPTVPIRRLISWIADGPFGSAFSSSDYVDDGPAVIRLGNIGFETFRGDDLARVPEEIYAKFPRCHVEAGDLLIASLGDANNHAGRACVAPDSLGPAMAKGKAFVARANPQTAHEDFLAALLSSPVGASALSSEGTGATRNMLNFERLLDAQVPTLPLGEQGEAMRAHRAAADFTDRALASVSRTIELLQEYKQSLITAAVTGEFDVTTAAPIPE